MKKVGFLLLSLIVLLLFTGNFCVAKNKKLVAVYNWYNQAEQQYCTATDGEYMEDQLIKEGWGARTFLFYAYKKAGAGRVAVNSWFNPVTKAHMTVCEDEYSDEQMIKNGYCQKHLQFYGLTKKSEKTVCVYRWLLLKRHCWVMIPDNNDTDEFLRKGYHHKTYQFYGLAKK
jgi:hypothetical protein